MAITAAASTSMGRCRLNGGRFERNRGQGFGNGGGLYAMGLNARGTVVYQQYGANGSSPALGAARILQQVFPIA